MERTPSSFKDKQTRKKREQRSSQRGYVTTKKEEKASQDVYASEDAIARSSTGYGPRYGNMDSAQAFVDKVVGNNIWKQLAPTVTKVQVVSMTDVKPMLSAVMTESDFSNTFAVTLKSAEPSAWIIAFNLKKKTSLSQLVILHELAHVAIAPFDHGPSFQGAYLDLVYFFLGGNKTTKQKIYNSLVQQFESKGLYTTFFKNGVVAGGGKELHIDVILETKKAPR